MISPQIRKKYHGIISQFQLNIINVMSYEFQNKPEEVQHITNDSMNLFG